MEDDHTRIVWFAMLAMADKNGEVQASIPGLANVARVPVESCRMAIEKFLSPDPYSRTKDDEGRRIEEIKGGWLLVNHAEYRQLASDEDRKVKAAIRQQRARDKKARNKIVTPASRQISQAEAEAEAESIKKEKKGASRPVPPSLDEVKLQAAKVGVSDTEAEKFFNYYTSNGWRVGRNPMKSWTHSLTNWKTNSFNANASVAKPGTNPIRRDAEGRPLNPDGSIDLKQSLKDSLR